MDGVGNKEVSKATSNFTDKPLNKRKIKKKERKQLTTKLTGYNKKITHYYILNDIDKFWLDDPLIILKKERILSFGPTKDLVLLSKRHY